MYVCMYVCVCVCIYGYSSGYLDCVGYSGMKVTELVLSMLIVKQPPTIN